VLDRANGFLKAILQALPQVFFFFFITLKPTVER